MDKSKTYWLLKTIIAMSYDFKIYGRINVQKIVLKTEEDISVYKNYMVFEFFMKWKQYS